MAATIDAGMVTLTGVVGSEVERSRLVDAATFAAGDGRGRRPARASMPSERSTQAVAQSLAQLIAAAAVNLVSGSAGFDGTTLFVTGVCADEANAEAITTVAAAAGITAAIELPPAATVEQAAGARGGGQRTGDRQPASSSESGLAVLAADAAPMLDELAARLVALPGVSIVVEGHTDSDGEADANLALSQRRADAVRAALVERGVAGGIITAEGFGEQDPLLVDGVEDKQSSRRVEFRIEPAG